MASDRISAEEANARALAGEPIIFVDARKPEAWQKSGQKIPRAIRTPADQIEAHLAEIDRNATVITYCT